MRTRNLSIVGACALMIACSLPVFAAKRDSDQADGPLIRTRAAGAATQAGSGRPITLLATSFLPNETDLIPTDVNVAQRLETPTLVTVSIPKRADRTALLVCISGNHQWEQVPSNSPLLFNGRYRMHFSNPALPGEFVVAFGMDNILEGQVSTVDVIRNFDPSPCATFDQTVLVPFLEGIFGVTADQAAQFAKAIVSGDTTISMTVVTRVQSVSAFNLFNAALDVFGN